MLTGPMVVARDIAHAKIKERLDAGEAMPQYLRDHCVYYAGPAKTPEGYASGSFGPTTAGRMDSYVDEFQAAGGSLVMLAKGNRSKAVTDACAAHGGFYLGSIGGPAARLALDNITQVEVLEYPELGMEAVWKIEVVDFPAFIVVDDKGNDFFEAVRRAGEGRADRRPLTFSRRPTTSWLAVGPKPSRRRGRAGSPRGAAAGPADRLATGPLLRRLSLVLEQDASQRRGCRFVPEQAARRRRRRWLRESPHGLVPVDPGGVRRGSRRPRRRRAAVGREGGVARSLHVVDASGAPARQPRLRRSGPPGVDQVARVPNDGSAWRPVDGAVARPVEPHRAPRRTTGPRRRR